MPAQDQTLVMHTDTFEIDGCSRNPDDSPLRVVIAYADLSSAALAKRILHDSLMVLSSHLVVQTAYWKFDLLSSKTLQEMAVEDAAAAHIIVISTAKEYGLPEGARNWIETCLTKPHVKDVAFVALVRDQERFEYDASPHAGSFEPFAAPGKSDFFWFIANDKEGHKLAAEKIIQLACQSSLGERIHCVG
jgi:uncharacterized protein